MPYVRRRFWEPHGDYMSMVSKHGDTLLIDSEDYPLVEQYYIGVSPTRVRVREAKLYQKGGGGMYAMHRVIMNAAPNTMIDHKNRNRFDNRKCNLRLCTAEENARNRCKIARKCSSKFKGVYWEKQGASHWSAGISIKSGEGKWKRIHLGKYKEEVLAAKAYDEGAKRYHGEFAFLNFPEPTDQRSQGYPDSNQKTEDPTPTAPQSSAPCNP